MDVQLLSLPELRKSDIITCYSQIRPYRTGGYRIEKQKIQQKLIFHNYGHGGSGVSLSYGSALKIVDIFQNQVKKQKKECAVIGSGIIGIMTALELANRGYVTKIYTKRIPNFGEKLNQKMMTSQIAPGFWFPYDYLDQKNQQILEMSLNTINYLRKAIEDRKYKAIKISEVFDNVYDSKVIQRFKDCLIKERKSVKISFGNGQYQMFNKFSTIKIDMQIWLNQLTKELICKKVIFIETQFNELKDVLALNQNYIFNCTGYESKYLFKDQKMKAFRGHLVEFPNPNPLIYNFIFGSKLNNQIVRIYAHQNRILLGLSKEENQKIQVDQQIVNRLISNYEEYLKTWKKPIAKL